MSLSLENRKAVSPNPASHMLKLDAVNLTTAEADAFGTAPTAANPAGSFVPFPSVRLSVCLSVCLSGSLPVSLPLALSVVLALSPCSISVPPLACTDAYQVLPPLPMNIHRHVHPRVMVQKSVTLLSRRFCTPLHMPHPEVASNGILSCYSLAIATCAGKRLARKP